MQMESVEMIQRGENEEEDGGNRAASLPQEGSGKGGLFGLGMVATEWYPAADSSKAVVAVSDDTEGEEQQI